MVVRIVVHRGKRRRISTDESLGFQRLTGRPYLVEQPAATPLKALTNVTGLRWFKQSEKSESIGRRDASTGARGRQRRLILLLAALLTPSALLAFTMAFWIIASDLKWTGEFFLNVGLFSHWQVWLCTAGVLLLLSRLLDRVGRHETELVDAIER